MRTVTPLSPNLVWIWLEVKVEEVTVWPWWSRWWMWITRTPMPRPSYKWVRQWSPLECKNHTFAGLMEAAGMAASVADGQRLIKQKAIKFRECYENEYVKVEDFRAQASIGQCIMLMRGKGNWTLEPHPTESKKFIQRPSYREFFIPCHYMLKDEQGWDDDEWDSEPDRI